MLAKRGPLLIALSCELNDFVAIVYTKENVAAKALADQVSDLAPPAEGTQPSKPLGQRPGRRP